MGFCIVYLKDLTSELTSIFKYCRDDILYTPLFDGLYHDPFDLSSGLSLSLAALDNSSALDDKNSWSDGVTSSIKMHWLYTSSNVSLGLKCGVVSNMLLLYQRPMRNM
jgi:hypothetical protein